MTGNELERDVKNILRKYIWGLRHLLYTDPITQAREKILSQQMSNYLMMMLLVIMREIVY